MRQYLELMRHAAERGHRKSDRTGTGTLSVFGWQMRFDLAEGFPLLTTKKLHTRSIIHELLWFLRGDTNIQYLKDNGVHIWDEWADQNGDLGPVYGKQWRRWDAGTRYIDQISELVNGLKKNPDSRRHIVTAWNPSEVGRMALPPCHCLFQFYVQDMSLSERLKNWEVGNPGSNGFDTGVTQAMGWTDADWGGDALKVHAYLDTFGVPRRSLSCQLYQRSADILLGTPFNIASYALLTLMVAQVCGYEPGDFVWTGGDCHLYLNHLEQARLQLTREPRKLPTMKLNPDVKDIFEFKFEDFTLEGYDPHPHIKAEVAV